MSHLPEDNGSIPYSAMTKVDGVWLIHPTARAWLRMQAAAKLDGVTLSITKRIFPWASAGGNRSWSMQTDMHAHPARYGVKPGIRQLPIGQSTHGWGDAVDVGSWTPQKRAWIAAHGHKFGFALDTVPGDSNHLQHDGHTAGSPMTSTAGSAGVIVEALMSNNANARPFIQDKKTKVGYVLDIFETPGLRCVGTPTSPEFVAFRASAKPTIVEHADVQKIADGWGIQEFPRADALPTGSVGK